MAHTKSNILQYNEYYPFGLQASTSWTRENNSNSFLYNDANELNQNSGWYETFFRGYDPTLGRFHQVDPLAYASSSHTPYNYAYNDPVFYNDPNGDYPAKNLFDQETRGTGFGWWVDGGINGFDNYAAQLFGTETGSSWTGQYGIQTDGPTADQYLANLGESNAVQWVNKNFGIDNAQAGVTYSYETFTTYNYYPNYQTGEFPGGNVEATTYRFLVEIAQKGVPDNSWYNFFADHNPGGDFLYELNKWNPIANAYNAISTYATGKDSYGVEQSNATATIQLASVVPIFKLSGTVTNVSFSALRQGIAKTLSNANNFAHIMDPKHNSAPLVQIAGSEANLVRRLYLSLGQSGGLPASGTFGITIPIYGAQVTIRGAVVNGVPRISTAFIT